MARSSRSQSHLASSMQEAQADTMRELFTAAEAADLQAVHQWLYCFERRRKAQLKMMRGITDSMVAAGKKITSSKDPKEWVDVQGQLARDGLSHVIHAQADMLDAWTQLHEALSKDMRANADNASWTWPTMPGLALQPDGDGHAATAWLDGPMKTWQEMASAWVGAMTPSTSADEAGARSGNGKRQMTA